MAAYKKQKFYCYSLSEICLKDENQSLYLRDNEQSSIYFATIKEAIDAFLKNEQYEKSVDTELEFQIAQSEDKEIVFLSFSKLLKEDGQRPTQADLNDWKQHKMNLFEHIFSISIYEFECTPVSLAAIKKAFK